MQYKTIFVIFVLLFSIVLFNGCTQRNTVANESIIVQDEDLTEYDIADVTIQSLIKFYLTSPIMHNAEIKELQERLLELGFINVGEIDGYYDHRTAGEIFFIKAALNFVDYYVPELDWRPEGYSVIDEELWGIIFDPEKATLLNSISQIRLFNNDPLRHEPENNPNVIEFKETQLPFTYPDWVPPWGMGDGRKIQREYYYNIGMNRISVIETIEIAFVVSTTVRDFSFQNGLQIRQSIVMADDPITTVRFSIPQDEEMVTHALRITNGNYSPPFGGSGYAKPQSAQAPLCGFTPPHFAAAGLAVQALIRNRKTSVTYVMCHFE